VLDRIRDDGRNAVPEETLAQLSELDARLAKLEVPYDEWQVLYRLRLQLERDARAALDHGADTLAPELGETGTSARRTGNDRHAEVRLPVPAQVAIGLGGAALVAVDVALQLADRRSTTNGGNGRH